MRMKDDHMKNGQLKSGDTRTLEPFWNEMKDLYGDIP